MQVIKMEIYSRGKLLETFDYYIAFYEVDQRFPEADMMIIYKVTKNGKVRKHRFVRCPYCGTWVRKSGLRFHIGSIICQVRAEERGVKIPEEIIEKRREISRRGGEARGAWLHTEAQVGAEAG